MRQPQDYYGILGVDRDASQEQIKRAFRRLARQHHPDVNPGDPESEARFKEISEAYEVLRDPNRRAEYDLYGRVGVAPSPGADIWGDLGGFGSIFDAFFGTGERVRTRPQRGADLRYDLRVELADVASGAEKTISVERARPCATCDATGSLSRSGEQPCPECRGTGQSHRTAATPFGRLSTVTACAQCRGGGTIVVDPCPDCRGSGRAVTAEELAVQIPAGADDGVSLRLNGEGEAGDRGAPPGDLYVVVHVKPHDIFERQGRDLRCDLPVPFTVAALGGAVRVPTLADGPEELAIPAGTQTGATFPVRGRGLPDMRTGVRGSLYVRAQVITPTNLTPRQQELLAEFAREGGDEIDDSKGWFARLRDALRGEEEDDA